MHCARVWLLSVLSVSLAACVADGEILDEEEVASAEHELKMPIGGTPGENAPPPPPAVVDLALGNDQSCVIYDNGAMKCAGMLVDTTGVTRPYRSPYAMSQVIDAVRSDGRWLVRAPDGLVQSVPDGFSHAPETISGLSGVVDVASEEHHLALRDDGRLSCWGRNTGYQCGTTTSTIAAPGRLLASDVVAAAAGGRATCYVRSGGEVRCVGAGPLVNGLPATFSLFKDSNALAIDAKGDAVCIVNTAGSVRCWGDNQYGLVGVVSPIEAEFRNPQTVPGVSGAVDVAVGYHFACALLANGQVKCWGKADKGQLGNGTTATWLPPVTVTLPRAATAIDAGFSHACARLNDGSVYCWGTNSDGRLGIGTLTAYEATPRQAGF